MSLISLAAAARKRAARARADDEGFMLIYVLAIVAVIAILVGGTLVVTTSAIVPGVQSAYDEAADAAAQGGLQAFVAYIDTNCPSASSSITGCTLPSNVSGTVAIPVPGAGSGYSATYSWSAAKDPNNRYFRVQSVGKVKQNGVSATKTVVGDIVGGSSLNDLDYGVITGFESESSSTVLARFPARTIALDCSAVDAADVPIKGDKCSTDPAYVNSINWSGSSPGSAAGKVAVCNATFDEKGGRANLPAPKAPNPYVDWTESGLNGNNYTDFQPCQTSWGTMSKLLAPVNPNDGAGGYYSNDAMLLSNSYPGGSGPLFNQPVSTAWSYTAAADAGVCSAVPGQNYRSFNLQCAGYPIEVGGSPSSASLYPDVQTGQGPQVPTTAPSIPSDACVYGGPTRVLVQGDTAVVTSPQTTLSWIAANAASRPAQCYTGATAQGMAAQTISLVSPVAIQVLDVANNGSIPKITPAIAHGSSGYPTTGQKLGNTASTANSVFYMTNGTPGTSTAGPAYATTAADGSYTPATGDNPSAKSDGAWVPQWTSDTASACNTQPVVTDLRLATCSLPAGVSTDAYSWLKGKVQSALAANSSNMSQTDLTNLLNGLVNQWNSADATSAAPTYADSRSHRWNVTVTAADGNGCKTGSTTGTASNSPINAPTSDPFFANTAGKTSVTPTTNTTCYTATVTAQVGTCNVALVSGVCVNQASYVWGNGIPSSGGGQSMAQLKVTFSVAATTVTTTTTVATSTFPSMADVTQYQMGYDSGGSGGNDTFGANGPGDLYVEGNVSHTMALIASDDLVVTGAVGPTGTNPSNPSTTAPNPDTTSSGTPTVALELIGQNNVRIYHPVKCRITDAGMIATTDPGFCPDDITGLYSSALAAANRPDQQYVNMRPDLAGLTIHAALFALGNDDAHITCPEPPSNDGICGGEFTVDNYSRGSQLGYITEIGTLAMAHHSPVGQEWEVPDTSGQSSRPYSGYQLAQQYQNIKSAIAASEAGGSLPTQSSTSRNWHILSISTGGS
jgi:hypothetical protein